MLNDGGEFPDNAEVVVAPPSIFLQTVKETIRPDIKVELILEWLVLVLLGRRLDAAASHTTSTQQSQV